MRCHDDIGWAITEEDAAAVGEDGYLHRRFLANFYAGDFPGSFARGARFYDGPDEVHRQSVARRILRGYEPPADNIPSEHVPTRREAAQRKFADLLEAVTSND